MSDLKIQLIVKSLTNRGRLLEWINSSNKLTITDITAQYDTSVLALRRSHPDLILIDIDLPLQEGLRLIEYFHEEDSALPIVVCSELVGQGMQVTAECLAKGATVLYDTKVSSSELIATCFARASQYNQRLVKSDELQKLKEIQAYRELGLLKTARDIRLLVIGASTGGVAALEAVLKEIPVNFPIPILAVLHIDEHFSNQLVSRLSSLLTLPVFLTNDGMVLKKGAIYLAHGGIHTVIQRDTKLKPMIKLQGTEPVNSCRPSIDVLLLSAVKIYKEAMISVILTGMGQDGLEGCISVHKAGGEVLVQDKESAVVWSMPGSVADAGVANKILPLSQLGDFIVRHVQQTLSHFKGHQS